MTKGPVGTKERDTKGTGKGQKRAEAVGVIWRTADTVKERL